MDTLEGELVMERTAAAPRENKRVAREHFGQSASKPCRRLVCHWVGEGLQKDGTQTPVSTVSLVQRSSVDRGNYS